MMATRSELLTFRLLCSSRACAARTESAGRPAPAEECWWGILGSWTCLDLLGWVCAAGGAVTNPQAHVLASGMRMLKMAFEC